MQVAVVSRIFAPEAAAASFRLMALARALVRAGSCVEVLTTTPRPGTVPDPDEAGIVVRRAPVLRDRSGYVRGYLPYASFDLPAFFRLLRMSRPDVVVVEPPPTTGLAVRLAAAVRRIPYVYYAADIWSDAAAVTGAPRAVLRVVRAMERCALRGAASVIAVSEGVAERVRSLAPNVPVEVVANGVDTEVFRPDGATLADAPWGIYAGTASEWQGAEVFIEAIAEVRRHIPEAHIAFVGQGSAWDELQRLAEELAPGAVSFIPSVPPAEAAALLRSARVGLVSLRPGQGYDFAVPTKIFATAATGTPVLFAGDGPSRALIEREGLGLSVDHDVHSVAAALGELLRGTVAETDRSVRAAAIAQRYSARAAGTRAAEVVLSAARGRA